LVRTGLCGIVLALVLSGCAGRRSVEPGIQVGEEALRNGSPQIAFQVAQGILARSPSDTQALLIKGDAATQLGQNNDAEAAFLQVLTLEPKSVHGKIGLGRLRLGTDAAAAATLFEDVLRQEPANLNALNNLGIARDLLGQHQEAQTFYRRARSVDPSNIAARVNLALSLAMTGNAAEALQLIEPLANDPSASSKLRHDYAAVLAMGGRERDAEAVLGRDMSPPEIVQILETFRQHRASGG
jgi:Flp pilus assembly protein TadD